MRKPFFWAERQAWYVWSSDNRKRRRLHKDKDEAFRIWHEQQAVANPEANDVTAAVLMENFLQNAKGTVTDKHLRRTIDYLASFCNEYGSVQARKLKRFHLTRWLKKHPAWGPWAQRGAISAVVRSLNWAVFEGLLTANPVAKTPLPSAERRETIITDDQHRQLMTWRPMGRSKKPRKLSPTEAAFRQVMIALRHTGARPGTVASVEAANVNADVTAWVMRRHKTAKKTKKPLTVHLSPCMQTLTRILLSRERTGPLFVNSRGEPWSTSALVQKMARLRERLGLPAGTVCYSHRHSYITTALKSGESPATVAELVGHVDLRMLAQNYSHLEREKEHLRAAAGRVIRPGGDGSSSGPRMPRANGG